MGSCLCMSSKLCICVRIAENSMHVLRICMTYSNCVGFCKSLTSSIHCSRICRVPCILTKCVSGFAVLRAFGRVCVFVVATLGAMLLLPLGLGPVCQCRGIREQQSRTHVKIDTLGQTRGHADIRAYVGTRTRRQTARSMRPSPCISARARCTYMLACTLPRILEGLEGGWCVGEGLACTDTQRTVLLHSPRNQSRAPATKGLQRYR